MNNELLTFVRISNAGIVENKEREKSEKRVSKIRGVLESILVVIATFGLMLIPGIVEKMV